MRSEAAIEAARAGEPWSVSGISFQLDDTCDVEGRPLSERRASPFVRRNVPFEVEFSCPYDDERKGKLINLSALKQISSHLKSALADVRTFRAAFARDRADRWHVVLATVLDQFSQPGVRLLLEPGEGIAGVTAVGHKLAAGYFGVLRKLYVELANGRAVDPTAAAFLDFVHEVRGLVGASEACAGPPGQIEFATKVLFGEDGREAEPGLVAAVPPARLTVADGLATQVRLGVAWELFDRSAETFLLQPDLPQAPFTPRNHFIGNQFDERRALVQDVNPGATMEAAMRALPDTLPGACHRRITDALRECAKEQAPPTAIVDAFSGVLERGEGALEPVNADTAASLSRQMARYVVVAHRVLSGMREVERDMRRALAFDETPDVLLHTTIFQRPRALHWFEVAAGHRVELCPGDALVVRVANHRRSLEVAADSRPT